jgi:hypothetical protein
MQLAAAFIAIHLVVFTGPDHQAVEINPQEVASIREPRGTEHFASGTHCLIFTTDGKFTAVVQTCQQVHERLEQAEPGGNK